MARKKKVPDEPVDVVLGNTVVLLFVELTKHLNSLGRRLGPDRCGD